MHPDLIPTFLIGLTSGFIAGGLLGVPIGGFLMWWEVRKHEAELRRTVAGVARTKSGFWFCPECEEVRHLDDPHLCPWARAAQDPGPQASPDWKSDPAQLSMLPDTPGTTEPANQSALAALVGSAKNPTKGYTAKPDKSA